MATKRETPALAYTQKKMLDEPLDDALVQQREDGTRFISIETAIAQANRIFGYGAWGYELVEGYENKSNVQGVQLYIEGKPICVAVGRGSTHQEAIDNGVLLCLRNFGNQFGLGLTGEPLPAGQND